MGGSYPQAITSSGVAPGVGLMMHYDTQRCRVGVSGGLVISSTSRDILPLRFSGITRFRPGELGQVPACDRRDVLN